MQLKNKKAAEAAFFDYASSTLRGVNASRKVG